MSGTNDAHSHEQRGASDDVDVGYVGSRRRGRAIVEKRPGQEQLTPDRSLELANHSPSGFSWDTPPSFELKLREFLEKRLPIRNLTQDEAADGMRY